MPFHSTCPGGDCCSCVIFSDFYNNRDGNLADDLVNLPGSSRYSFAPGSWHVDTTSGKLVCDTGGELITFMSGANRIVNVQVDCNLSTVGDYVEVVFGAGSARAERIDSSTIRFTSGSATFDDSLTPSSFTFYVHFFQRSRFASDFECFSPTPDEDFIRFGPSRFLTCPWNKTDFGSGFATWGLRASTSQELDNLIVSQATRNCENFTVTCSSVCWSPPETVTVSISGAVSGKAWCGPVDVPEECSTNLFNCLVAAEATTDPDTLARCAAGCACYEAYNSCHCGYIESNGSCVTSCACASMNGEHVMSRVGGPCSCEYSTTITYTTNTLDHTAEEPCEAVEHETAIGATLQYEYCDTETGEAYVSLYLNMPFASSSVAYWWTGIINADAFCLGGSIPLQSYPEGSVQYADEILLGCSPGCATPTGYGCGDGGVPCTYTVGEETLVYECAAEPTDFLCDHATHTPVTIGPNVVVA